MEDYAIWIKFPRGAPPPLFINNIAAKKPRLSNYAQKTHYFRPLCREKGAPFQRKIVKNSSGRRKSGKTVFVIFFGIISETGRVYFSPPQEPRAIFEQQVHYPGRINNAPCRIRRSCWTMQVIINFDQASSWLHTAEISWPAAGSLVIHAGSTTRNRVVSLSGPIAFRAQLAPIQDRTNRGAGAAGRAGLIKKLNASQIGPIAN